MEMELMSRILIAARSHDDLPYPVVEEIVGLATFPERLAGKGELLETLLRQLDDYDPYAGVGCFGSGTTLERIRQTLGEIRS